MSATPRLLGLPKQLGRTAGNTDRPCWRTLQYQWHRQLSQRARRPAIPLRSHKSVPRRHQSTTSSAGASIRNYVYGSATLLALSFGYLYITDTRASLHQYLFTPLLRVVHADPEEAHHAGIRHVKGLYDFNLHPRERGDHDKTLGDLHVEVFGHILDNPVGTSAGIDKNAEIPSALFALGAAIVEVGGVTPLPQEGNPKPRVFRIPSQNALINRYGLNSEGVEHVAMQLRERVRQYAYHSGLGLDPESERIVLDGEAEVPPGSLVPGKLLAVQIAKNKTTPDNDINAIARDYVTCVEHLAKYADIIVVNVSSPNTPGLRDLQAIGPLTTILTAVVKAAKLTDRATQPAVMVKVSPDEDTEQQVDGICAAVWRSGVDGVIVGNTTNRRPDTLPKGYVLPAKEEKVLSEMGGFSGPHTFPRTLALVKRYREKLDQGSLDDTQDSAATSKGKPSPPAATQKAPPPPANTEAIDASVQRDAKNLKPLTAEADAASKQSILKIPERHFSDDLESSGQLLEPASVTSVATAIAPPPSTPSSPAPKYPAPSTAVPAKSATGTSTPVGPAGPGLDARPAAGVEKAKVIFATGGIATGDQCLQILNAGASVCQVYTAMMYGGVGTITRIKKEIRESIASERK